MGVIRIPKFILLCFVIFLLFDNIQVSAGELPTCTESEGTCTPTDSLDAEKYCVHIEDTKHKLYKLSTKYTKPAGRRHRDNNIENVKSTLISIEKNMLDVNKRQDSINGACAFDSESIKKPGTYFFSSESKIISNTDGAVDVGYKCESSNDCTLLDLTKTTDIYVNCYEGTYDYTSNSLDGAIISYDSTVYKSKKANKGENYVSSIHTNGLITCDTTCKSVPPSSDIAGYYVNSGNDNTSKQLIQCKSDKCESIEVTAIGYYVSSTHINGLITCTEQTPTQRAEGDTQTASTKKCVSAEPSSNNVGYYINSGDDKTTKPLIHCKSDKCEAIAVSDGTYYLDKGNEKYLITCTGTTCSSAEKKSSTDAYYINSGKTSLTDVLIKCNSSDGCTSTTVASSSSTSNYYINGGQSRLSNALIECESDACIIVSGKTIGKYISASTKAYVITCTLSDNPPCKEEKKTGYFLNAGKSDKDKKPIIYCTNEQCESVDGIINKAYYNTGESKIITCTTTSVCEYSTPATNKYYINAGTTSTLIICDSNINDGAISCNTETGKTGYYISAVNVSPLVYCDSTECTLKKGKAISYYPNMQRQDSSNTKLYVGEGVYIYCESETKCTAKDVEANSYFVNSASTDAKKTGILGCTKGNDVASNKCEEMSVNNGYYINAGSDNATKKVIYYDGTTCSTVSIKPGYYHSGVTTTTNNVISYYVILYDGDTVTMEKLVACPSDSNKIKMSSGKVCVDNKKVLNFVYDDVDLTAATNTTKNFNLTYAEDSSLYYYVSTTNFPGSSGTTVTTLFEVSKYYISRVIQDGSLAISNTSHTLSTSNATGSLSLSTDTSLYECKASTKLCTLKSGCTNKTYMIDLTTSKGLFCDGNSVTVISTAGYYIDGGRTNGNNTPNVLKCSGVTCETITPKSSTYFINSGHNSNVSRLIYCNGTTCVVSKAEVGYYAGYNGLLHCTSETACTEETPTNNVYYINIGVEKSSYSLITCTKNVCTAVAAGIGYYLTKSQSVLINCTSSSACTESNAIESVYSLGDTELSSKYIIDCEKNNNGDIVCELEYKGDGYYIGENGMLINCMSNSSTGSNNANKPAAEGVYRSAKKTVFSMFRSENESESELEKYINSSQRASGGTMTYNLITCTENGCAELTSSQLAAIPICTFNNNKCEILAAYARFKTSTTVVTAGGYCTSTDRSQLYFATNAISVENEVVSSSITESNCIEVSSKYSTKYFTVDDYNIYHIDNGEISKITAPGYYFIDTSTNELASGDISKYNESTIAIYKCNNKSCNRVANPTSETYYADINKRIIKYSVQNQSFIYAFDKDVKCEYANGSCTVDSDLDDKEFCINYKGELILPQGDLKNKESGTCYKSTSASVNIFGFAQFLFKMDAYSAKKVNTSGYYLVNKSTNVMATYKDTAGAEDVMLLYGCNNSVCKIYEPETNVFYYDINSNLLYKYNGNEDWETLTTSGYAYIATNPNEKYVYKITINPDNNVVTLKSKVEFGYYYTIDEEMYECSGDSNECSAISENDYYFTEAGELFKCVYDSEGYEKTECSQISCVIDQYYFMINKYYRCQKNGIFEEVNTKYCYNDVGVIINYPVIYEDSWPNKIKESVEGIVKVNNSTAVTKSGKSIEVIPGVFTNCTYDADEEEVNFDMVCINNYVRYDKDLEVAEICAINELGYVECIEDANNPNKCKTSGANKMFGSMILYIVMAILSSIFIYQL